MRKLAGSVLLIAVLAAAPAASAQTVPTRAALEACHTGTAPLDRYAVFTAQMATVPQAARMQLRFDLLQRLPGDADYRVVRGPGLGVWRSSVPGVDIFRYRKQVANLQAAGSYRALVRFRWLDVTGHVLQSTARRSRTCRQPDLRPDLRVGAITAQPAGGDRARYAVEVINAGRTATPPFSVAFTVGDQAQPSQTVQPLLAGQGRTLTFAGPRCDPQSALRVTVDPDLAVDESDETNNTRSIPCPLAR